MARRVAAVVAAGLSAWAAGGPALAAIPPRAGIAEALLGRWERAADRLGGKPLPDRAERYFQARALLELGRRREALALLKELCGTAGAFSGPALEAAAEILFAEERHGELAALAREARAERFQDENRLRYRLGQSLFLAADPAAARPQLEKVAAGPFLPYALYTLALIAQGEGRVLDAVETLGKAVDAAATHPDAAVAAALADRIRLTRGRVLYQAAVGLGSLGEADRRRLFDLASAQFERIGKQSPFYPEALRGAGWCALEKGDSPRALAAFESASEIDPERRHEDLWAQGRVYQRLGYPDEAARLYADARKAAEEAASRPFRQERAAPGSGWGRLFQELGRARERAEAFTPELRAAATSVEDKGGRIASTGEKLDLLGQRTAAARAEVADMGANLEGYLDTIGAPALFPKAERARLDAALARQERLGRELASLETVFERLGNSAAWARAGAAPQKDAESLWRRLTAARTNLSRSEIAFLQGLKGRVSTREEELRRAIEAGRSGVAGLGEALAEARGRIAREGEGLGDVRRRVESLEARRAELLAKIEALEDEVRTGREAEERRGWEERRRRLRLKADAYALDETEALHLWEEKGRSPAGGAP